MTRGATRFLLCGLAVICTGFSAFGQSCQVGLPVTFLDRSGQPISHIAAADLQVVRPTGASLEALTPAPPQHVEILIDRSGSMAGKPWAVSKANAEALLAAISPPTEVRIAVFEDMIALVLGFHAPARDLSPALAQFYQSTRPRGATAFYDSLVMSVSRQASFGPGDAIIALSDGDDNSSRTSATMAINALQQHQIRLVLLRFAADDLRSNDAQKEKLLRQAGGASVAAGKKPNAARAAANARQVWAMLAAQYRLTLNLQGGDQHSLEVKAGTRLGQVSMLAATTRLVCPAPR